MHHTSSKGNIGVARATADLIERGYDVLLPVCSTSPFDLAIYDGDRFLRVQVKYITAVEGVLQVTAFRKSIWNGRVKKIDNDEVDLVCVFCPDTQMCYYIRAADTPRSLRISETKNGYKTGLHWARDYLLVPTTQREGTTMSSVSKKQEKLMNIAAHTPGGYGGVPQSVGKEFHAADKAKAARKQKGRKHGKG